MARVLVVEDDPNLRKLIVFALGLDAGFTVEACGSGEEALACLAATPCDVVLLDLEMPGIGGHETARRIGAGTPIFIITGTERPALEGLPVRGVIKKPFDPVTLAEDLRRRLEAP